MILYYAMGSGLGHLTRARAVLHTLAIHAPVTLITASPWCHDTCITDSAHVMQVPAALLRDRPAYRHWLCRIVNLYPITPLLPLADRIIMACGFNVMRQTAAYREQHRFLPFPRHLDDQFLRAVRHRPQPERPAPPDVPGVLH